MQDIKEKPQARAESTEEKVQTRGAEHVPPSCGRQYISLRTWANVTLWDLGENDENFSDDDAEGVTLSVQVTIFSESDEVELAREIKSIMKENDFSFEGRNGDDSKPEDGIYMKAQRFSKFYEMEE